MSESTKNPAQNGIKAKSSLIDSIYLKYTKSVIRALASTEFYDFFMSRITYGMNEFQFSNRRLEKLIDVAWVEAIDDALPAIQNIISNPRSIIREDELIVNVANARKSDSSVVRHLAQHGAMVDNFEKDTGEVRPNRLMQKLRDDSNELYENRLFVTTLESAFQFVKIRHDALMNAMTDEFGAKLKLHSTLDSASETVEMDLFLHIKEKDDFLETDNKHRELFEKISRLYRVLSSFVNTPVIMTLMKLPRVHGAVVKTNVLKKNPNYKSVVKLYEFLQNYPEIGYSIKVIEQNPEIDEDFQQDIYHSIMYNYIMLKHYLEDDKSRALPTALAAKKRVLKPKFIKEIVEELTENYDLPDVEVRRVLIEELTKEQLMKEQEEERLRLVEEQERRRIEEEEAKKRAEEEEAERIRKEKEQEEERIRAEEEAERIKIEQELMERKMEDYRRGQVFRKELEKFTSAIGDKLQAREEEEAERLADAEKQGFEDAAKILEEQEKRRKEEAERAKKRKEVEEAMARFEKEQEELRRKEAERLRAEAELARKEAERKAAEEEQKAKDREQLKKQIEVLEAFKQELANQIKLRKNYRREGYFPEEDDSA